MTYVLDLPYPPSVNHYWRRIGPRTLISRSGKAFRQRVCDLLSERQVRPLDGPLAVTVDVYLPDDRCRDLDNLSKSLLDALEHGHVFHDDNQIETLTLHKRAIEPPGRVVVTIQQI
ncbi:MAG: RusA family crossover junction endodeoxyribonuclease [Proteobacteria bacterium]|nr:RusA family crossover junction endodeoxyribonuclease [Pseudomonadota bacterium]